MADLSPCLVALTLASYSRRLARYAKTTFEFLADLEHELRLSGHPVRFRPSDGQHERHLRIPRRQAGSDSPALARGAAHRPDYPAHHRTHERPYMGPARTSPAVSALGGPGEFACADFDAQLLCTLDGRWIVVGAGC